MQLLTNTLSRRVVRRPALTPRHHRRHVQCAAQVGPARRGGARDDDLLRSEDACRLSSKFRPQVGPIESGDLWQGLRLGLGSRVGLGLWGRFRVMGRVVIRMKG